ncbi:MAG: helix-turn-helix transcriptional regulator [Candidatus Eremiobacteraeota bacterium]|nr:helix-turn-helix transcriptional regulator [Candidatus Eremiobacteraeota bacterium]
MKERAEELRARVAGKAWRHAVGAAVRRARGQAGLTQAELGDLIGASLNAVSEIERGVVVPTLSTVWLLADALRVPIDHLVGRVFRPPKRSNVEESLA